MQQLSFFFSPRFSLYSDWLYFVSRSSSRPYQNDSLLFSDCHCIPKNILLFPRYISSCFPFVSCAISFHSSARILLSYRSLPFVVDLLQIIGCEWSPMCAFCLANVFHCISMPRSGFAYVVLLFFPLNMAFWSRVMGKYRLSGPQWVDFSAIQSTLSKRTLSKPDTSLNRTANLVHSLPNCTCVSVTELSLKRTPL